MKKNQTERAAELLEQWRDVILDKDPNAHLDPQLGELIQESKTLANRIRQNASDQLLRICLKVIAYEQKALDINETKILIKWIDDPTIGPKSAAIEYIAQQINGPF